MNIMKIKQLSSGAVSAALALPVAGLAFVQTAAAADAGTAFVQGNTNGNLHAGLASTSIGAIIQNLITWGLYTIGGLGVLGFIYAGFLYITAGGEESKVGDAKKVMMYAVVGVIVALIGLIAMNTINAVINGSATTTGY